MTDSPDPVVVGQNVTYTFTVRNQGPTYASSVTLANRLNAGLTVLSITPSQGTCSGTENFTCSLGRIDNTQVATVIVVARVDGAGMFINSGRATVSSRSRRTPGWATTPPRSEPPSSAERRTPPGRTLAAGAPTRRPFFRLLDTPSGPSSIVY